MPLNESMTYQDQQVHIPHKDIGNQADMASTLVAVEEVDRCHDSIVNNSVSQLVHRKHHWDMG